MYSWLLKMGGNTMARHAFNFLGGEELTTMGACWFVSYCYYDLIDSTHMNWNKVTTCMGRKSVYVRTGQYHKGWLLEILNMSDGLLNTNSLELKAPEVKNMARKLLNKF